MCLWPPPPPLKKFLDPYYDGSGIMCGICRQLWHFKAYTGLCSKYHIFQKITSHNAFKSLYFFSFQIITIMSEFVLLQPLSSYHTHVWHAVLMLKVENTHSGLHTLSDYGPTQWNFLTFSEQKIHVSYNIEKLFSFRR